MPLDYARSELVDGYNHRTLKVFGRGCWHIGCFMKDGVARIVCGWEEFVSANNVGLYDSCAFQRSRSNRIVWNVTIYPV